MTPDTPPDVADLNATLARLTEENATLRKRCDNLTVLPRHLEQRIAELEVARDRLRKEVERLQRLNEGLAERVAQQSDLLSRNAEEQP